MDQKAIRELSAGEAVVAFYVLRKKELKLKRENGEAYLTFEFGDASGRINGSLWDNISGVFESLTIGDVVKAKGTAITFHDRLHLNIEKIRVAEEKDDVDITRLVPVVEKDRRLLFAHLEELIAGVANPHLNKLLNLVFRDEEICQRFCDAPGGKLWHHNYLGGLLEHTLSVTDIADKVAQIYPGSNHDLIITAGLLHDIGKIDSYTYKTLIDFTDQGRLVGHIVIGAQIVTDKIKDLPDFPESLKTELLHLILSHQGKLEQASPVVPMTLEGLILYYADELDSKANAFLRIEKKEKRPGQEWSSYVQLMERYFYFGPTERK
jgi:3'-5' exoribonuclease